MEDFEAFVRARAGALMRTAYLLTGDRHLAEDLLQDTLARVAERWRSISQGGDPEPYVRRVLYTRAVDGWRRRRRLRDSLASVAPAGPGSGADDAELVAGRVVFYAYASDRDEDASGLLLGADGSVSLIPPADEWLGFPAGWLSEDLVAWLWWDWGAQVRGDGGGPEVVQVNITTTAGALVGTQPLRPTSAWRWLPGQWAGTVSPDGTEIAVVEESGTLRRFSLADGTETAPAVLVSGVASLCAVGWAGPSPTASVWDASEENATTVVADGATVRPVVTVEPGTGTQCFIWAADALAGEAYGGLWGMPTGWWTWWWREILAGIVLAAVAWGLVRRHRRVSPRRVSGPADAAARVRRRSVRG